MGIITRGCLKSEKETSALEGDYGAEPNCKFYGAEPICNFLDFFSDSLTPYPNMLFRYIALKFEYSNSFITQNDLNTKHRTLLFFTNAFSVFDLRVHVFILQKCRLSLPILVS